MNTTWGVAGSLLAVVLAGCVHAPSALTVSTAGDPAFDAVMVPEALDRPLLSRAICQETNRARLANGIPALEPLAALDSAADMQASFLALTLTVGHLSMYPHEQNVAERVARAGLQGAAVGENAIMMPARRPQGDAAPFYTYREYAAFLVGGWMASPEHRETMLASRFTRLGCAARPADGFGGDDKRIFAIQVFLQPHRLMSDHDGAAIVSPRPAWYP